MLVAARCTPSCFASSSLQAINDAGQAVGSCASQDLRRNHAALYDSRSGVLVDLNTLIADPASELWSAIAINQRGQVLGYGRHQDQPTPSAFLATPR